MYNSINVWLKQFKKGNFSQYQSMLSQSTSSTFLLEMTNLQQWIENVYNAGRGNDLTNLLSAIPAIEKLSGYGLGLSISDMGLVYLDELTSKINCFIQRNKRQIIEVESNNSSEGQKQFQSFKNSVREAHHICYSSSKGKFSDLQRLNKMRIGFYTFLQNSSQDLLKYLENANANLSQNAFKFHVRYVKKLFGAYTDCEIEAFQGLYDRSEKLQKKGYRFIKLANERIIIKQNEKQQQKQKEQIPTTNSKKNLFNVRTFSSKKISTILQKKK